MEKKKEMLTYLYAKNLDIQVTLKNEFVAILRKNFWSFKNNQLIGQATTGEVVIADLETIDSVNKKL